mmetsp:Transcript_1801/g.2603  ORF Transcript_1801/g.2603 Transcript_1801/m.2603 type:complete len:331 (-) Transcript_1801:321-1313(-)
MVERKSTCFEGSFDKKLSNRRGQGNLGLNALLDDIPNFGHTSHDGWAELLKSSNGVCTSCGQSLRISITDCIPASQHRELGRHFQNVCQRQVAKVDIQFSFEKNTVDGAHGRTHMFVSEDDTLWFTGGSRCEHDNGASILFRWFWCKGSGISRCYEIFKRNNLDSLGCSWNLNVGIGCHHITCVDNCLESLHFLALFYEDFDVSFVTENGADIDVVDRVDNSINTKSCVDGGYNDTLRKGAKGGDHPFGTCIFEDCKGTRSVDFVKSGFVGCRNKTVRTKSSSKLHGSIFHFFVGTPFDTTKLFHFFRVLSEVLTSSHGFAIGKLLETIN